MLWSEESKDGPADPTRMKSTISWGIQAHLFGTTVSTCKLYKVNAPETVPFVHMEDGHAENGDQPTNEGDNDNTNHD